MQLLNSQRQRHAVKFTSICLETSSFHSGGTRIFQVCQSWIHPTHPSRQCVRYRIYEVYMESWWFWNVCSYMICRCYFPCFHESEAVSSNAPLTENLQYVHCSYLI